MILRSLRTTSRFNMLLPTRRFHKFCLHAADTITTSAIPSTNSSQLCYRPTTTPERTTSTESTGTSSNWQNNNPANDYNPESGNDQCVPIRIYLIIFQMNFIPLIGLCLKTRKYLYSAELYQWDVSGNSGFFFVSRI